MSPPDPGTGSVSILLLNWNGWRDTVECLESIFRLEYANWNVIVCDNASTDDSVQRIRFWAEGKVVVAHDTPPALRSLVEPPSPKPVALTELSREEAERGALPFVPHSVVLIHNGENLGFAGGNNVGLRHLLKGASPGHVWILNNDTVVSPDSLSHLVECAASTDRAGAVGGTLMEYHDPDTVQYAAGGMFRAWNCLGESPKSIGTRASPAGGREADVDYVAGSCLLAPMATIARVGVIAEEYFMYGEDVEFSLRIREAGLKLLHAGDARVWHKGGASIGHRTPRQDYFAVRNALHLVERYYPRMMWACLVYLSYRVVLPKVVRGQWTRLAVVRRAYADFSAGVFGAPGPLPGEVPSAA